MILTVTLNPSIDRRYNVQNFEKGNIFRTNKYQYTAGGKGLNVAKVIENLNERVIATGLIGGRNGEFIKEELDKRGIKYQFTPINGETRSCLAILSNDGSQTEILEGGPLISKAEMEEFLQLYDLLIEDVDIICASGSIPQGVSTDIYKDLIKRAKRKGKKLILDTSGAPLKAAIEMAPSIIKPNLEELEALVGNKMTEKQDIVESGKELLERGIEIVVISLGKEGVMALNDGHLYQVTVPEIRAVNPVGSGDSLVGGLAVAIGRGYDLEQSLRLAAACGTANAMEAETGKVDLKNVEALLNKIQLKKTKI
ncbi:MAG TPA: 1-phosphofructokinase [Tissierellaceae bacterium]|nr:1-phosphofructokinase [Tissierellaceae bacterium]